MADETTWDVVDEGKVTPNGASKLKKWRKSLKQVNLRLTEVNKKLYLENGELRREVLRLRMRLQSLGFVGK